MEPTLSAEACGVLAQILPVFLLALVVEVRRTPTLTTHSEPRGGVAGWGGGPGPYMLVILALGGAELLLIGGAIRPGGFHGGVVFTALLGAIGSVMLACLLIIYTLWLSWPRLKRETAPATSDEEPS